jgi:DNA helicase II / ATP-dependent DNA helicase PcrA
MTRRPTGEKVTIMTMHAAKGLEFDTSSCPGWEEGVFPSSARSTKAGERSLEEERRLAYVAITRARRAAVILHAANRRIYGQWTSSIPSRFIAELPEEHIEVETTLTGGASLWRANWSEHDDPFAHVARARPDRASARGPGWQRALATRLRRVPAAPGARPQRRQLRRQAARRHRGRRARVPRQVRLRRGDRPGRQQARDRVRQAPAASG